MIETFFPEKFADSTDTTGELANPAAVDPARVLPTRAWGAMREDGPIHPMMSRSTFSIAAFATVTSTWRVANGANSRFRWFRATNSSVA